MRLLGWDLVKPLSQDQARDLGAELLGEVIVLLGAILVTSFESNRSSRKEKEKERAQNEDLYERWPKKFLIKKLSLKFSYQFLIENMTS